MAEEVTLTPKQVEDIRKLGREGIVTPKDLAITYGVPVGHIMYIIKRSDK